MADTTTTWKIKFCLFYGTSTHFKTRLLTKSSLYQQFSLCDLFNKYIDDIANAAAKK